MSSQRMQRKSAQANRLIDGVNDMKLGGEMTDFLVQVDTIAFKVHRLVLAASSPYFRAMLTHNMKESIEGQVVMRDVTSSAIETCLQFMYTGEVDLRMTGVDDVLYAASFMQLDLLVEVCGGYLEENITVGTAIRVRALACTYNFQNLDEKCKEFIQRNLTQISTTPMFFDLTVDEIAEYAVALNIERKDVWVAMMNWVRHATAERLKFLARLLRLFCSRTDDLESMILSVWTHEEVRNSKECQVILQEKLMTLTQDEILRINKPICCHVKHIIRNCEIGDTYRINEAMNEIIVRNFEEVSKQVEFHELLYGDMVAALRGCECSDMVRWEAIVKWTKHDKRRTKRFPELLRLIKLSEFSMDFIQTDVRQENLVKESKESMEMLLDALALKLSVANVNQDIEEKCDAHALKLGVANVNQDIEKCISPETSAEIASTRGERELNNGVATAVCINNRPTIGNDPNSVETNLPITDVVEECREDEAQGLGLTVKSTSPTIYQWTDVDLAYLESLALSDEEDKFVQTSEDLLEDDDYSSPHIPSVVSAGYYPHETYSEGNHQLRHPTLFRHQPPHFHRPHFRSGLRHGHPPPPHFGCPPHHPPPPPAGCPPHHHPRLRHRPPIHRNRLRGRHSFGYPH